MPQQFEALVSFQLLSARPKMLELAVRVYDFCEQIMQVIVRMHPNHAPEKPPYPNNGTVRISAKDRTQPFQNKPFNPRVLTAINILGIKTAMLQLQLGNNHSGLYGSHEPNIHKPVHAGISECKESVHWRHR